MPILIIAAVLLLTQVGFLFQWTYRLIKNTPEEDLRSKNIPFSIGNVVRIVLNYFITPIVALSCFQLVIADSSPTSVVAPAAIVLVLLFGSAGWLLYLISLLLPAAIAFNIWFYLNTEGWLRTFGVFWIWLFVLALMTGQYFFPLFWQQDEPDIKLVLNDTSLFETIGSNVTIGETITFTATLTIPHGNLFFHLLSSFFPYSIIRGYTSRKGLYCHACDSKDRIAFKGYHGRPRAKQNTGQTCRHVQCHLHFRNSLTML